MGGGGEDEMNLNSSSPSHFYKAARQPESHKGQFSYNSEIRLLRLQILKLHKGQNGNRSKPGRLG